MKVAVIGGGISGLCAAWELKKAGADVSVFEQRDILGGCIQSEPLGEMAFVEQAADAFLARVRWGYELCQELGLQNDLVSPICSEVLVKTSQPAPADDRGLKKISQPHILGIPMDLAAVPQNTDAGGDAAECLRADLERTQIKEPPLAEETVGSLVRRRLGDYIFESQVAPLIGAISASNPDLLSAEVATPLLAQARELSPSLVKGLKLALSQNGTQAQNGAQAKKTQPSAQLDKAGSTAAFYAPAKGMGQIVKRLAEELKGCTKTSAPVESLENFADGAVILATPAHISKSLVKDRSSTASQLLSEIPYSSVAMLQLVYKATEIPKQFSGIAGVLFPPLFSSPALATSQQQKELNITAVSFATQKWGHYKHSASGSGGEKPAVLRVSVGRYKKDEILQKTDSEISSIVLNELADQLGIKASPSYQRISRWQKSFPQYFPGHFQKMSEVKTELAKHRIYLAGSYLGGVGIPACIESAKAAAEDTLASA